MKWIILIGGESFGIDTIKSMEHFGSVRCFEVNGVENRYCVDFGDEHIFYDYGEIAYDYGEDELSKVPYENLHFITMVYSSKDTVKKVLTQSNFPGDIYIDNDHGLLVPFDEFIGLGMPLE